MAAFPPLLESRKNLIARVKVATSWGGISASRVRFSFSASSVDDGFILLGRVYSAIFFWILFYFGSSVLNQDGSGRRLTGLVGITRRHPAV